MATQPSEDDCRWTGGSNTSLAAAAIHPAVLCTQGLLTILANIIFCLTVLNHAKLRTTPNYLLLSNSMADLLVGVYVLPVWPARWQGPALDHVRHEICLVVTAAGSYFNSVSVAHWAAIAVERLLRIFYVAVYKKIIRRLLIPTIFICWLLPTLPTYGRRLLPIILETYPYNVDNRTDIEDTCHRLVRSRCECSFCVHKIGSLVALTVQYFLPMALAVVCYTCVMVGIHRRLNAADRLHQSVTSMRSSRINDHPVSVKRAITGFVNSKDFRSIQLFLIILVAFFMCIAQYLVNRVRIIFGMGSAPQPAGVAVGYFITTIMTSWSDDGWLNATELLGYLNSLLNPLLIFALSRRFRKGCRILFCRVCVMRKKDARNNLPSLDSLPSSRWNELANRFYRDRAS